MNISLNTLVCSKLSVIATATEANKELYERFLSTGFDILQIFLIILHIYENNLFPIEETYVKRSFSFFSRNLRVIISSCKMQKLNIGQCLKLMQ